MRVAIDARRLQDDPLTGVGRGLRNQVPLLAQAADIVLLVDGRRPVHHLEEARHLEVVALRGPRGWREPFWLQLAAARWLRSFTGIFHGTYNAIPMAYRGPSVLTLHDLAWEHHPEDLGGRRQLAFKVQARASARRAGAVIAVSDFMRRSIAETYRLDPDRIVVAPQAVDPQFGPQAAERLRALRPILGLPERYIVALSGARRRGVDDAVAAWRQLALPGLSLVVVGPAIASEVGIVCTGSLPDGQWASVLAGAEALCYPTRYEGFGMPALEAAASGTPVVCARVGPLPEILGDAAQWCATTSALDLAAGLAEVLHSAQRHQTLRAAGLVRAAVAPTWADSAQAVLAAYAMAVT